jgi:3-oxoadipate enol-lactonase
MPFLDAGAHRIHYRIDGRDDAPPILLSNSLGADITMWDPQIPALVERYRVIRYDSRGHGASAVGPGPYTIEQLGRDALALADGLGLERFHFCGLSMGGMVGMWLAAHTRDRVDRLVLCNTAARIHPPDLWNQRIEKVRAGGMAAIADAVVARWFTQKFLASAPAEVDRMRKVLLAQPAEGYAASCAAVRDMDQREAIRGIRAPTLVIAGTHDLATPPADARLIVESIPGARYVELDAAHIGNVEVPAAFDAALLPFIGGR